MSATREQEPPKVAPQTPEKPVNPVVETRAYQLLLKRARALKAAYPLLESLANATTPEARREASDNIDTLLNSPEGAFLQQIDPNLEGRSPLASMREDLQRKKAQQTVSPPARRPAVRRSA